MRVFVYEEICATCDPRAAPASLQREGRAMLEAVVADLTAMPEICVATALYRGQPSLPTPRVEVWHTEEDVRSLLDRAARWANGCLVIAPELDGVLLDAARRVLAAGGRLLGPGPRSIELFADKQATAQHLGPLGLETCVFPAMPKRADAVVLKPIDGAGASFTAKGPPNTVRAIADRIGAMGYRGSLVTQPFDSGLPASIAMVIGRTRITILPAVEQVIGNEPWPDAPNCAWMTYGGGRLPLTAELNERALRLAQRFLALDNDDLFGYCGLDIVLGNDPGGASDRILEVNPRLTTSYVGYRQLRGVPLGPLLLDRPTEAQTSPSTSFRPLLPVAEKQVVALSPPCVAIDFRPDGRGRKGLGSRF